MSGQNSHSLLPYRVASWLCLSICLLAFAARILPGPRTIDDAYITFRYARNLLSGAGLVFNPGERVLGTTTPLYTALLATSASLAGGWKADFPQVALVINALADALACWILFQLGRMFGSLRVASGVALVWAIAPFSVTFAIGGLETSVYVLILLSAVYAHVSGKHIAAAVAAALAFLARPDALILLIPLGGDRLWQLISPLLRSRPSLPAPGSRIISLPGAHKFELLAFIIPICAWLCFSTIYFGSPVPQSIAAKSVAYRVDSAAAFIRLLQHYMTPFLEHLSLGTRWIAAGLVLYPFLYLSGAWKGLRINPRIWPFVVYPWLYLIVYSLANPLIFRWYLTPPLPALILFILIGLDEVALKAVHLLVSKLPSKSGCMQVRSGRSTLAGALCAFLVVFLPVYSSAQDWKMHPDHGHDRPAPEMSWYRLELLYRQVAGVLQPELVRPGKSTLILAAGDVGVLGYYTQAHILDTVGLNSPISASYYPLDESYYAINYAIPPQLLVDQLPDYLVFLEIYGREGLLKDPRISSLYSLTHTIPTDIYGSRGLLVMERK